MFKFKKKKTESQEKWNFSVARLHWQWAGTSRWIMRGRNGNKGSCDERWIILHIGRRGIFRRHGGNLTGERLWGTQSGRRWCTVFRQTGVEVGLLFLAQFAGLSVSAEYYLSLLQSTVTGSRNVALGGVGRGECWVPETNLLGAPNVTQKASLSEKGFRLRGSPQIVPMIAHMAFVRTAE